MGMTKEEAKAFLTDISYDLGTMGMEYLSVKDGEKMREAIETLEQELKMYEPQGKLLTVESINDDVYVFGKNYEAVQVVTEAIRTYQEIQKIVHCQHTDEEIAKWLVF